MDSKSLNDLLSTLIDNLSVTKNDINSLLDEKFNDLKPLISKSEKYQKQMDYLNGQIEMIRIDFEEKESLLNHLHLIDDYKHLIERIDDFKQAVCVLDSLHRFESKLVNLSQAIDAQLYKDCDKHLNELKTLIENDAIFNHNTTSNKLNLVKYLREEYQVQKERLQHELELHWDKYVVYCDTNGDCTSIRIDSVSFKKLCDDLRGTLLEKNSLFKMKFNNFCLKLLKLFENIIQNSIEIKLADDVLRVLIKNDSTDSIETKFESLKQVLSFVTKNLLEVKKDFTNNLVENNFLESFLRLIYDQLIISTINLNEYNQNEMNLLCEQVMEFQKFLANIHMFDEKFLHENRNANLLFKDFQANVKLLYVQKKCRHVLDLSRNLMKSTKLIFECIIVKNGNDGNEFKISQVTQQIKDLTTQTLDEAIKFYHDDKSASNSKNICMFTHMARNVIDLFTSVVPCFHKENLINLPLLSAICFNDFYHLSDFCLDSIAKYKLIFSIDQSQVTLIDLVPKLRLVGSRLLERQIERQNDILNEYIDCLNGLQEVSEGQNVILYEKSIEKFCLHLHSLSSIWKGVLPKVHYHRIFGQFFDLICKRLIGFILNLEDISADDASYFVTLLNKLNKSVLIVFNDDTFDAEDIEFESSQETTSKIDIIGEKHVKQWMRYKYLIEILKANLQQIVDLWSSSQGPLALYFTSDEVRNLIKALFMITEKRNVALSKIY